MNKEQATRILKDYIDLVAYLHSFRPRYLVNWDLDTITRIEFRINGFEVNMEYFHHGSMDYDGYYIPYDCIEDVNKYHRWLEDEQIRKVEQANREKAERERLAQEVIFKKEYEIYLRLKEQLEDGNHSQEQ